MNLPILWIIVGYKLPLGKVLRYTLSQSRFAVSGAVNIGLTRAYIFIKKKREFTIYDRGAVVHGVHCSCLPVVLGCRGGFSGVVFGSGMICDFGFPDRCVVWVRMFPGDRFRSPLGSMRLGY